jgi:hypothetical protein
MAEEEAARCARSVLALDGEQSAGKLGLVVDPWRQRAQRCPHFS